MRRIKRVDGRQVDVDDSYILANGESYLVPLHLMDSKPHMITDSRGNPAGQRPGFLYADTASDTADAIRETVHRDYRADIEGRWRSDRWNQPKPAPAPVRPQADATTVDAAYDTYNHDIQNRWRR